MKILNCPYIVLNSKRDGCYYWTWSTKLNAVVCTKVRKLKPCPWKEDKK